MDFVTAGRGAGKPPARREERRCALNPREVTDAVGQNKVRLRWRAALLLSGANSGDGSFRGGRMSKKPTLSFTAVALACLTVAAWGQAGTDAKQLVDGMCNSCHALSARIGAGYTPEGWRTVVRMMINQGVAIQPEQLAPMTVYLAKPYPEQNKPAGK